VFLSTDAGGTGLNLQVADTVINLEVPWNPAVLEQRVARVHRMGQHRAVQVINLVMRDTIEERVLKTLMQKKAVFEELFTGTSDEIALDAMGQQTFLETIRELLGQGTKEVEGVTPVVTTGAQGTASPTPELMQAGVVFLETLAQALTASRMANDPQTGQAVMMVPLPEGELLKRGTKALAAIVAALGERGG
jgi:hypothetical protein